MAYRHGTLTTSAEAAAAYRHALQHGNGPEAFDYRNKIGVAWVGLVAPEDVPDWMRDPHKLWRAVDELETRVNARLAQEIVVGLPHHVTLDDHIAMLTELAKTCCVDPYRLIADIAIHAPPIHHGGDPRHWHAHILLTDRPADQHGFCRIKDRRTSSKEFVTQLREAWTRIHNAHMERLGLPYRIDHRTLEAQRKEALQRGDTIQALDLDRLPQIRLGKAVHTSHPNYAAFTERRRRNLEILTHNKDRAAANKDHLESAIARADTDAYLESRRNARLLRSWQPSEPPLYQLQDAFGRPESDGRLGRLKDLALNGEITRRAIALSRAHGHPWFATGHRDDAPDLLQVLLPMVADTGPGHPVFTVTAKDLLFAFYNMGMIGLTQLRGSLENIAAEEERLFPKRAKTKKLPPLPKPPTLPTPDADRLKLLQQAALVPRSIYAKRLAALTRFNSRHHRQARTLRRARA